MFKSLAPRIVAWIVLIAFINLSLQPLEAAAKMSLNKNSQPGSESVDERYGKQLAEMNVILERAGSKSSQGEKIDDEVALMLSKKKSLEALESDVEADIKETERHLKEYNLPSKILERHRQAVREFKGSRAALKRLLKALEKTEKTSNQAARRAGMQKLAEFMKRSRHKRPHTPVDPKSLPFRAPSDKVQPPREAEQDYRTTLFKPQALPTASAAPTALPPAPRSTAPAPEDLVETEDVQLTPEIRRTAEGLGRNPVKIYNWVRNNIRFIPTYGSVQGAEMTLRSGQGNALDTASLLIALFRASNIPARYVYGTIRARAADVVNWTGGAASSEAVLNLMAQGGIPCSGVISGGAIESIKMEHVWVEAWVDYIPSRGSSKP